MNKRSFASAGEVVAASSTDDQPQSDDSTSLENAKGKPVCALIVTPTHDGKLFDNYTLSLMELVSHAARDGMWLSVYIASGESLITRARNNAVATFLRNPDYTHLLWIDSDIGFSVDAVVRLLSSDYDVCAGVYPLKREEWPEAGLPEDMNRKDFEALYTRYTVNTGAPPPGDFLDITIQPDGFVKLDEAPTGFMAIKRQVFERMMIAYPELRYMPDSIGIADEGLHYRFFDCMVDPKSGRYLSEDYGFCRLWNELGGSVFVDAWSNLSHRGGRTYRGEFAASLKRSLDHAVGAPSGTPMRLFGSDFLGCNPPGPA